MPWGNRGCGRLPWRRLASRSRLSSRRRETSTVLKGPAAFGDWRKDKPGVRRLLTPQDLPAPSVTPSHVNFAETAAMPAGAKPEVPPGFAVEMVASRLKAPRAIRVAPNGDLFVAETHSNTIRVLRITDGAKPVTGEVFATGLYQPYGMAFYPPGPNPQWLYMGTAMVLSVSRTRTAISRRARNRNASSSASRGCTTTRATSRCRRTGPGSTIRSDPDRTLRSTCSDAIGPASRSVQEDPPARRRVGHRRASGGSLR